MARFLSNTATFDGHSSSTSTLSYLFFIPGFLLAAGAFVLQLGVGDLTIAAKADTGSLLSQIVLGSLYFVATIILFTTRNRFKMLISGWPILVMPILALASATWSDDPELTLRRAFALVGTVFFGLSFASVFNFRQCVSIVTGILPIAMLLSIVWVLLFPETGVHLTDVHVGLWRGIFAHRNTLGGQWGSITFALLSVYGHYAFKSWALRIVAIIVTLICLVGANSGTGYVLAAVIPLFAFSMSFIAAQPKGSRLFLISVTLIIVLFLYLFADEISALVLWSIGKYPDFTGRTAIWHNVTQLVESHWLFGRGYFVGYVTIDKMIKAFTGSAFGGFGSAHNGYLEILVYFGYFGLTICLMVLAWLTYRGLLLILQGASDNAILNTFPVSVVAFALVYNTVESQLMAPNSLVTLLLAIVAGMIARLGEADSYRANPRYRM